MSIDVGLTFEINHAHLIDMVRVITLGHMIIDHFAQQM